MSKGQRVAKILSPHTRVNKGGGGVNKGGGVAKTSCSRVFAARFAPPSKF